MCTAPAARQSTPSTSAALLHRWRDLLARELAFVCHPDFAAGDGLARFSTDTRLLLAQAHTPPAFSTDVPEHGTLRLGAQRLLTPAEEQTAFLCFNFWKFQATRLRARLSGEQPSASGCRELEQALDQADLVRDLLVRANVRLVVHNVKRSVSDNLPLDELVSDGLFALLRAIEKFDVARGFRFSTYATIVVRRAAVESLVAQQRWRNQWAGMPFDDLPEPVSPAADAAEFEPLWPAPLDLGELFNELDERERLIVSERYTQQQGGKRVSLERLGAQLGISKERARQLEKRALAKLKAALEKNSCLFAGV